MFWFLAFMVTLYSMQLCFGCGSFKQGFHLGCWNGDLANDILKAGLS